MEYIFTERAHLMCPRMCFGIVMTLRRTYDEAGIRSAADRLASAHPFLNAVLGYEEKNNAYYYRVTDQPKTELLLRDHFISDTDSPEIMEEYEKLTDREWDLFREGMLKIAAWPMHGEVCFLLVFHHLLADGRGALGLAEELADCYVYDKDPVFAAEKLISSKKDLPEDSRMPFVSRFLIGRANKNWAKENRTVSYDTYRTFADAFLKTDQVRHSVRRIGPDELDAISRRCHDNRITVNDCLLAIMMIKEHTGKIIIACDLRDRLGFYRKGAMGNYSTAFSVNVGTKTTDLYKLAGVIHAQVKKKMSRPGDLFLVLQCYAGLDPGILDAALISCRGDFPSKTGRFVGKMFFGFGAANGYSITNLGRIESTSISSAFFIPPASPAIRKTQGVLTVNDVMTICTSERRRT